MNEGIFENIIQLTEEMEQLIKDERYELLGPILGKRKEAFGRLESDPSFAKPEAVFWIKKIRAAEKRCEALAADRKKKIGEELLAMQNGKRALHAYGRLG